MQLTIGKVTIRSDTALVDDLRLALCEYHGRLAKRIGNTGDMQQDTVLAERLIHVQEAYNQFPVTLER